MPIRFARPNWPHPEPDEKGNYPTSSYFEAIGRLVTRWNTAEIQFQALVKLVASIPDELAAALLTHVNSATLSDAFLAAAHTKFKEGPYLDECIFIKKLFEANRVNRNFVVHCSGPVNDDLRDIGGDELILGQEYSNFTARGKLVYSHYYLNYLQVRTVCEEVLSMNYYFSSVGWGIEFRNLFQERPLQRPDMPKNLQKSLQAVDVGGGARFPSVWARLSPNV